jgi:hypothetical protein
MNEFGIGSRPVLVIEGDGDKEAVPFLLRRIFPEIGQPEYSPAPRPIMCGDIPKLRKDGVLEKFVEYACSRSDGNSALLILDCDDDCPVEVAKEFTRRVRPIAQAASKRVGIAFMYREFETLFLYSLRLLTETYPQFEWRVQDRDYERDWTEVRGAKGALNSRMRAHYYKETRDQSRFVSVLDLQDLRGRCRSVEHLFRLLSWLSDPATAEIVYPVFAE